MLERLIGGAAVDTHAKSLRLGISDEALLQGIMKDPALSELDRQFQPSRFAAGAAQHGHEQQGYLASERESEICAASC